MRSQEEARTTVGPPAAGEQVEPLAAAEPEELAGVLAPTYELSACMCMHAAPGPSLKDLCLDVHTYVHRWICEFVRMDPC